LEGRYFTTKLTMNWTSVGNKFLRFNVNLLINKWPCVVSCQTPPGMIKACENDMQEGYGRKICEKGMWKRYVKKACEKDMWNWYVKLVCETGIWETYRLQHVTETNLISKWYRNTTWFEIDFSWDEWPAS